VAHFYQEYFKVTMADFLKLNKYNLQNYDFKILIDRSYSMNAQDCENNLSRWRTAHKWSKELAHICSRYDDDGIDVILFDNDVQEFNNVKASTVDEIFRNNSPRGSTRTDEALKVALKDINSKKAKKPVIILVLTDGEPNSRQAVINEIIKTTKNINSRKEVGISFLQVGNDSSAKRYLEKLDDDLESEGAKFDIVDSKCYSDSKNMKAEDLLIAALTD
jgi:uncharacterized protein with von Willebrand factor type A (vWA) domain